MKTILTKRKECKDVLYCVCFIAVLSTWIITCAAQLTPYLFLKTTMLITLSYIAVVFDISTKRIPNTLVLLMVAGWLLTITPMIFVDTELGIRLLTDSIYGSLIGGGLFLLVYLLSRKGLGGGDVKFMAAAGLYLGFAKTVPAILYGTVLASLTGLVLILIHKIGRKDSLPLAPFLFIGIMIIAFTS